MRRGWAFSLLASSRHSIFTEVGQLTVGDTVQSNLRERRSPLTWRPSVAVDDPRVRYPVTHKIACAMSPYGNGGGKHARGPPLRVCGVHSGVAVVVCPPGLSDAELRMIGRRACFGHQDCTA
jgi:hypothetical protein